MSKLHMFYLVAKDLLKKKLSSAKNKNKVGALGYWADGGVEDLGDVYFAYIDVNGAEHAVMVKSTSKRTAMMRRDLIIQAVMGESRKEASEKARAAVQLIARTEGDKTVEMK